MGSGRNKKTLVPDKHMRTYKIIVFPSKIGRVFSVEGHELDMRSTCEQQVDS